MRITLNKTNKTLNILMCVCVCVCVCVCRRVYLSVAAAAIYMASQASEVKKTQKGKKNLRTDL